MVISITQKKLNELLDIRKQLVVFHDIKQDVQQYSQDPSEDNPLLVTLKEQLSAKKRECEQMENRVQALNEEQRQKQSAQSARIFSLQSSIHKKEQELARLQTAVKDVQGMACTRSLNRSNVRQCGRPD